MTNKLRDTAVWVAFAIALAGCSSDDDKAAGTGGTSGSAGSGGSGGSSATVKVTGLVSDFAPRTLPTDGGAPPALPPVAGVEVCVIDQPSVACATTDAKGEFTLTGVPANVAEFGLTFVKSGYLSTAILASTGTTDVSFGLLLPSDAIATGFAGVVGIAWPDPANGVMSFTSSTSLPAVDGGIPTAPLDGVSVSLSPSAGEGPFYTSDGQVPDKALTETSKSGLGFFARLPPADYDVTFTHPTKTSCARGTGWASSKANSVKIRVMANFLVGAQMVCD